MFEGFHTSTLKYYEAIRKENCKNTHTENEALYLEGVKLPLEEMYFELYHYFSSFDSELLSNKRRCISSPYNDARFCREAPIKEYFYIRFKLDTPDKKNALGFFFDASLDGYKYGLNIYNLDGRGMEKIRDGILDNKYSAKEIISRFHEAGLLELQGEKYKRKCYPQEDAILQDWLERKRISLIHEECIGSAFYGRELLERILSAFGSAKDVYFMLKGSL